MEKFWNLGLQIAGKCISDTFFVLKPHIVDDDDESFLWYGWPTKGV